MIEILVGVTVLIPVILVLRWLTKGKISMGFRYALWLTVVLRLIVPVSFGNSSYSMASLAGRTIDHFTKEASEGLDDGSTVGLPGNAAAAWESMASLQDTEIDDSEGTAGTEDMAKTVGGVAADPVWGLADGKEAGQAEEQSGWLVKLAGNFYAGAADLKYGFLAIWVIGMATVSGYMLIGQIRFLSYLHRARREIPLCDLPGMWAGRIQRYQMHVYLVRNLPTPCMAGHSIYLTPKLWEEKDKLPHILAHEYAHAIQRDSLWALVRGILCAVYWFHPLVWVAAFDARQDSELACDEKAIRLLGEKERFAYGRTLLDLIAGQRGCKSYEGIVLTMNGSGRRIKERVTMIAGKRKNSKILAAFVICMAVVAGGCAFAGGERPEESDILAEGVNGQMQAETREAQDEEQERLKADIKPEDAEDIEKGEDEMISQRLDAIEAEDKKVPVSEFGNLMIAMEDDLLQSAEAADRSAYFDYLYEGGECPLQDWTWYLIGKKEEADLSFYGLYTKQYGLRGIKVKVRDDVNTFDLPWIPSFIEPGVEVLEQAEDGAPRTFAFQLLAQEDGTHEIWNLYLADRYDTGTLELYSFDDYGEQFRDMVELRVNKDAQEVELVCQEDVVGTIDISGYADYTVEQAVWDGSAVSFLPNSYPGADELEPVAMVSFIGLKLSETDEIQYRGLSAIICPVDIGTWGERRFTLQTPRVDDRYVSAARSNLE